MECYKKAYTLTSTALKTNYACGIKCVGTCPVTPGKTTSSGLTIGFNLLAIVAGIFMLKMWSNLIFSLFFTFYVISKFLIILLFCNFIKNNIFK